MIPVYYCTFITRFFIVIIIIVIASKVSRV